MPALEAGVRAPGFTLTGVDQKTYSLEESLLTGPVLVGFLKVSCPVCQFTFPFIERFYRVFRESKAQIWAISQDKAADSEQFAAEYGLTMPMLLDQSRKGYPVSNAFGITHVPSLFLIGQNGEILQSSVGWVRKDIVQLARRLETLTGKKGFVPVTEDDDVPDWRGG
jgi:peroxiredoxin